MATSERPRVFLDTNIIYSGIYSSGSPPSRLLALHSSGLIRAVVSQLVIEEALRNIRTKAPSVLPDLLAWMINSPPEVVSDPSDDEMSAALNDINFDDAPVWAAVITAQIDYFITGDRRFLREARAVQSSFTVLTPRELLNRIAL